MTNLPNARALHLRFSEEESRARRTGQSFQVVMLDLDEFKQVNDTFGHQTGDQMLREVGRVLQAQLREYDFLARYAGDEFVAIVQELSDDQVRDLRERIERAMRLALSTELRRLELRLPFLATLGSAAPFIGLFGTVWGIMRSFEGIATANSTSLAVVAPGIAEALFATAMGLAAAIPAVVAYNKITVDLGRFAGRMQGLIGRSGGLLARTGAEA